MPAPYSIEETSQASGLSVKFIRRLKDALPQLFAKHTERGPANALLFDEEILEVLKQTKELRNRGRTLRQIRDELATVASASGSERQSGGLGTADPLKVDGQPPLPDAGTNVWNVALERENTLLRSQVTLLQTLLQKSDERFDRLLPAGKQPETSSLKSQLLLWLVEAVVVTAFASGFIFLIWFFAQKAFRL